MAQIQNLAHAVAARREDGKAEAPRPVVRTHVTSGALETYRSESEACTANNLNLIRLRALIRSRDLLGELYSFQCSTTEEVG